MLIKQRFRQAGVSLLEVMVSVLILAFGLLGLAALQTSALRNNQSSFQKTQAVLLTYFIADAIRIDRANISSYTMAKTCVAPSSSSGIAGSNKMLWLQHIQTNLGSSACGEIACNTNDCSIKIYWNDERGTGGLTEAVIETSTRF